MPHITLTMQQAAAIRRHMEGDEEKEIPGLSAEAAARLVVRQPDLRPFDLNVNLQTGLVQLFEPRPVGLRFGERVPPRRQTPAGRDVSPPARDWNRRTLRESGKRRAA